MNTYAQVVNGRALNPCFGETKTSALAATYVHAWVQAEQAAGRDWVQVPTGTTHGAVAQGGGQYENPPASASTFKSEISRRRFDAFMGEAIGWVAYDDILDTLAAMAAAEPKTESSVKIKAALRALDDGGPIDFPLGDWMNDPQPGDLTAAYLLLVIAVMTATIPDIAAKILAGLAAWRAAVEGAAP